VAVKLLKQDAGAAVLPAVREAMICAKLKHPNIIRVLHVQWLTPLWVIIMELVEGAPLAPGAASCEDKPLFGRLADALWLMADSSIVHRDVKPANVMLRASDRSPVLIDFGLAVDLTAEEWIPLHPAGTPIYMSPEALNGGKPAPSWDWYSLGVTAVETLLDMPLCRKYGELSMDELLQAKRTGTFAAEIGALLERLGDSGLSAWCAALTDPGAARRKEALQLAPMALR
jgi:serine/threonine protein kinase